ncbi:cobyric acid synthase [Devosia sp.]|uniref:cobyric acid synthase n=1 Tax=Devosia sp. TaxID=1871048 RepID=UPI0035ADC8A4
MPARSLMFMGTGSDVGKSLIVAGLCRAFADRGLRVAPFKPQNMSNNAGVTVDGGEIGRAQMLQARAARRAPVTAMNPVLLKPEHEAGSQVIVRGRRIATMPAREYWAKRGDFLPSVLEAYDSLAADADLVLVEGAGSASEINLRHGDIANFGFARARNLPVVLIGDIQRGGVIASLVGTFAVIDAEDARLIAATLVNKFQGDPTLFDDGLRMIAARTGVPCLGPVRWFDRADRLPAEDSLGLAKQRERGGGPFVIAVPHLPHIANFDDLDPLRAEPGVEVVMVRRGDPIPEADLIVLPGSKATIDDFRFVQQEGWGIDIMAHHRRGRPILGICGGYQMLGERIEDALGIEGLPRAVDGFGLLRVDTRLGESKQLRLETARHNPTGEAIEGYHIHMGETRGEDCDNPFATVAGRAEGAISRDGLVMGTYLHGLFAADGFRRAFLGSLGAATLGEQSYERDIDQTLQLLAWHLEAGLDLDRLLALARPPGP